MLTQNTLNALTSILMLVFAMIVPVFITFFHDHGVHSIASPITPGVVFGYRIDLTHINVKVKYVINIDGERALVIGSFGNVYGVAAVRIENPYVEPTIEDMYPLTGYPASYATNGYPVTRIAVGSDKGEILVLSIDRGRITKHLYAVLGSDFHVSRLFITRGNMGSFKIVALVSESGLRGYPCLDCHVYIFDEEASGLVRIGPKTGNATISCSGLEGVRPQDVSPLLVYERGGYYYDASKTIISYISDVINLFFTVNYFNESAQAYIPVPNVLVEVRLRYVETQEEVVYGVNSDKNGLVKVPIPRVRQLRLTVQLVIRDVQGNVVYEYTYLFDPTAFREIPDEIPLPSVVLPSVNVDTRPASALYGVPPFLEVKLDALDLSQVPSSCTKTGSADFTLKPHEINLYYLKGAEEEIYKVIYVDALRGFLNIAVMAERAGNMSRVGYVLDYVGTGVEVVSVGTVSTGDYIIAGLSDGRLRLYTRERLTYTYRLRSIYTMGSRLLNLITIPLTSPYTYVAISSSGVQVFRVEPAPTPVYRGLASLYLATPRYVHGDALGDLSTIALAEEEGLIVVKNTNVLVQNPRPTTLDQILAVDVSIHLYPPRDEDLRGTIVELLYPGGSVKYELINSTMRLRNIIPGVNYTINILPSLPYISNASMSFTVREDRKLDILASANLTATPRYQSCYEIIVNLTYREFNLKLKLSDEFTGSQLLGLLDVYVDGVKVVSRLNRSEVSLRILYGVRTIEVAPASGFEHIYASSLLDVVIDRDMEVEVKLNRIRHAINLRVVDEYGQLLIPVDVSIKGVVNYTITIHPDRGNVLLVLPYGEYEVVVTPHDYSVYSPHSALLFVDGSIEYTINPKRIPYKFQVILIDPFGLIGEFNLYANGTKVASGLRSVSEVELPCGVYLVHIEPTRENEAFYEKTTPLIIRLFSDLSLDIPLTRRVYNLKIVTMEGDRPIRNALVTVISYETGETVITLNTDESGTIDLILTSGFYKLIIRHEQFVSEELYLVVTKDASIIITMKPTILTLVWRYLPTIGALVGVGLAVYAGLKIKAYISSRIEREEEII